MSAEFQANDAVQVAGGHINSNNQINSHIHHHGPSQPAAPLPPLRRCPLPSPRFTGRKAELEKMSRFFFREELKRRNFAIIGMGGCGKSQLAFSFVHDQVLESDLFDPAMVFFIDATTLATLEESWKAIAESKGIENNVRAALDWLSNSRTPSFVLVDNADDPQLDLREYLPRSTRVSILFTTRLHDVGHKYGSGEGSYTELQALEQADAEELLMTTARLPDSERPSVRALIKELHCYALAVVQAGAGIRTLHLSVDQYIQLFRQHRTALMDGKKDGVTPDSLDAYRWTVQSAYRISVSHLQDKLSARALLGLLGHLHHSGITEEMFRRAFLALETYKPSVPFSREEETALSLLRELLATFSAPDGAWDTLAFRRAMSELNSLLSYDKTNGFQIHPLICDALRDDHPDGVPAAFLLTHARLFEVDNGVFGYRLVPHADRILSSLDEQTLHPDLASSLGRICVHLNQGSRSQRLLKLAVERCQREAGADAPSTWGCLAELAYVLHMAGRHSEVLGIQNQVLKKRAVVFGPDHPETVEAMGNLAVTLRCLGRYDEAESMKKQVLEKRTVLLGPDHPEIVLAMGNLAVTLRSLGRYDEVESMDKQVLEKRTVLLGPDHPETVLAMGNLAVTLRSLGRYDEAESMGKQVLEKRTVLLGPDHPETVLAMGNLAVTLRSLGRYDEAESMKKQVLEKRTVLLGPDHPETVLAMANLAATLRSLGRYDEAESMGKQVLEKRTVLLGPNHPETIRAMANLAATLHSLGRYDEAESMKKQVLDRRTVVLGSDHPDVSHAMANLSHTVRALGRKEEAHSMMENALALLSKSLGEFHPRTVDYRHDLGLWQDELDQEHPPLPAIQESPQTPHSTIDPPSSLFIDPPSSLFIDPPSSLFIDPPSSLFIDPPSSLFIDNTSIPQCTSSAEAHSLPSTSASRPPSTIPPRISSKPKGFLRHVGTLLKPRRRGK